MNFLRKAEKTICFRQLALCGLNLWKPVFIQVNLVCQVYNGIFEQHKIHNI